MYKNLRKCSNDRSGHLPASGARLVLDYPGTIKVRRLKLGGVRKAGVVSAATDPDYIGGIGSIEVVPSGITVNFR